MDESKTTTATSAPETPAAPKKERRVGRVAFALLLIIAGVLLLAQQFVPSFDLFSIVRFAPALLIVLGVELLVYSANPNIKVKFDWLSVLGCGFILVVVGGASLVPLAWRYVNPARDYARNNYANQLQDQAYRALNADSDLKARVESLYVGVYFNHLEDGDYTLQDEDMVTITVDLKQNGYATTEAFAADCYRITQLLEENGLPIDDYCFNSYSNQSGNGNQYSLDFLSSFFEGLSEQQLAQRVTAYYEYDGTSYSSLADRDNAVKAVLREEVIGEFAAEHDGEYPGDEYVTQEVEKRFQALYPTPTAAPEVPAATPETAA